MVSQLRACVLTLLLAGVATAACAQQADPAAATPPAATPAVTDPITPPAAGTDPKAKNNDYAAPNRSEGVADKKTGLWIDKSGKPLLTPDGKTIAVQYNAKGKAIKLNKVKLPKTHPIAIVSGTLTVDGWTGKAQLNYDIPDLKYIYLSSPAVGTVIISQQAFVGSTEQKDAFHDNTLTVKDGDHLLQLASDKPLLGKKNAPAWVKVDADYTNDARYPVMGFGATSSAPYEWPGAKVIKKTPEQLKSRAPPLPASMVPKFAEPCVATATKGCPAPPKIKNK